MNTPLLETERLLLRKFTEDDMDALFLILSDEDHASYIAGSEKIAGIILGNEPFLIHE